MCGVMERVGDGGRKFLPGFFKPSKKLNCDHCAYRGGRVRRREMAERKQKTHVLSSSDERCVARRAGGATATVTYGGTGIVTATGTYTGTDTVTATGTYTVTVTATVAAINFPILC